MNETSATTALVQPAASPAPVFAAGLVTTAAALAGVHVLSRYGTWNIMGWYGDYIIPAGALIVGVAAASGYGALSWWSGVKITKPMLLTILALQVVAYFAAQYIPFHNLHLIHRGDGSPVRFWEYFDYAARSFAWKQHDGSLGRPLGIWGYFFRGLELIGFCGGSLLVPALLRKAPFCQTCQRYMRTKQVGLIPSSIAPQKIKKSDTVARETYQARQAAASEQARAIVNRLWELAVANNSLAVRNELQAFAADRKKIDKLPQRIAVSHVCCKNCWTGYLKATLITGQGKQIRRTEIGTTPVSNDFARVSQPVG